MTPVRQSLFILVITLIAVSARQFRLKHVSVVFRHGDRAPDTNAAERFPNDPYVNDDFFPHGVGGLTNQGKRREFVLGRKLRDFYGDFLGDIYSPLTTYGRSTNYERTKMSLQAVMAGLFPPTQAQRWHPDINWQPVITDYVSSENDFIMVPEECPQYLRELRRVKNLPDVRNKLSEFSVLMRDLSDWTGKQFRSSNDMFNLYHALTAENSLNLDLPRWSADIFPNGLLLNGTILEYDVTSYGQKMKRLNGGMLLRNIIETMENVIERRSRRKLTLLSGHETNVAALLKTLGIYYPHVPQYSSAVIVELLSDGEEYYIRIKYYLGIPAVAEEMSIPGCNSPCSFRQFIRVLRSVIPSDEDMICVKDKVNNMNDYYNYYSATP
uniref:acid phosphatase n=1 Tax=Fopius arisanus TaxID=64838 RepID=A0A0C9PLG4_9HYME